MKWIPIDKAKVKFDVDYLLAILGKFHSTGRLKSSVTTANGVEHTFTDVTDKAVLPSHIAIITDPNKE